MDNKPTRLLLSQGASPSKLETNAKVTLGMLRWTGAKMDRRIVQEERTNSMNAVTRAL